MILIPVCHIYCLQITGPTVVSVNSTAEYRIYMEFPYPYCEIFGAKLTVWLSYGGSDIKNGVDFYGPEKIIFEIGETSKTFPITFKDTCTSIQDKTLKISMTADYTKRICSSITTKVSCAHFKHNDEPVERPGYDIPIPESKCGKLFFFDPYNHKTKTSNNMK